MIRSASLPPPPADVASLLDKAARCRRLAALSTDRRASEALAALAAECEAAVAAASAVPVAGA